MSIELNSFTNLIEENKLRFYKTAKAILKNDDDVYDALQEALMSIYQNFRQLKDLKFFSTWATRIVINKAGSVHVSYAAETQNMFLSESSLFCMDESVPQFF